MEIYIEYKHALKSTGTVIFNLINPHNTYIHTHLDYISLHQILSTYLHIDDSIIILL